MKTFLLHVSMLVSSSPSFSSLLRSSSSQCHSRYSSFICPTTNLARHWDLPRLACTKSDRPCLQPDGNWVLNCPDISLCLWNGRLHVPNRAGARVVSLAPVPIVVYVQRPFAPDGLVPLDDSGGHDEYTQETSENKRALLGKSIFSAEFDTR